MLIVEMHSHVHEIQLVIFSFCSELLWVAPELIPSTVVPGTPATQKGDVYSFAIILEEIVVRGGPFEAARQFLDPQGDEPIKIWSCTHILILFRYT
jgi:hypothetical protein